MRDVVLVPDSIPGFLAFGVTVPAVLSLVALISLRRRRKGIKGYWAGLSNSQSRGLSDVFARTTKWINMVARALPLAVPLMVLANIYLLDLADPFLVSIGDAALVLSLSLYLFAFSSVWRATANQIPP